MGDDDTYEEYDAPETIAAIAAALSAIGIEPCPVVADAGFPARLRDAQVDLVLNLAEGSGGRCREAVPAAILEFLGLPYTGSDALTLAVTLDKAVARRLVSPEVPVARAVLVEDPGDDGALATLASPVVVKPNDEGSSKGIRLDALCHDLEAVRTGCWRLFERTGRPVLVEQFLPGAEVTVAVRGSGRGAAVIGAMEIAPAAGRSEPFLYALEVKRDFRRRVRYHVPPRLPAATLEAIGRHALVAHRLLGCRDIARLDFRLDAAGVPHFLECNPLPGLNPSSSDLVILWRALHPGPTDAYPSLVQGLVREAARRLALRLPSEADA